MAWSDKGLSGGGQLESFGRSLKLNVKLPPSMRQKPTFLQDFKTEMFVVISEQVSAWFR